jgi:hypothetical protein
MSIIMRTAIVMVMPLKRKVNGLRFNLPEFRENIMAWRKVETLWGEFKYQGHPTSQVLSMSPTVRNEGEWRGISQNAVTSQIGDWFIPPIVSYISDRVMVLWWFKCLFPCPNTHWMVLLCVILVELDTPCLILVNGLCLNTRAHMDESGTVYMAFPVGMYLWLELRNGWDGIFWLWPSLLSPGLDLLRPCEWVKSE